MRSLKMKNLSVFLVVFALCAGATPAFADWFYGPHDGHDQQGMHWHSVPRNSASAVGIGSELSAPANSNEEPSLISLEVARVFLDKGYPSDMGGLTAHITVRMVDRQRCYAVSRYWRRRCCYPDPEAVVYVTIKDPDDKPIAVGVGDDRNPRDAAREAAENATDKLKEKKIRGNIPIIIL